MLAKHRIAAPRRAAPSTRYPQRDPLLRPLFLRLLFRFSRRSDVSGVTIGAAEDTERALSWSDRRSNAHMRTRFTSIGFTRL